MHRKEGTFAELRPKPSGAKLQGAPVSSMPGGPSEGSHPETPERMMKGPPLGSNPQACSAPALGFSQLRYPKQHCWGREGGRAESEKHHPPAAQNAWRPRGSPTCHPSHSLQDPPPTNTTSTPHFSDMGVGRGREPPLVLDWGGESPGKAGGAGCVGQLLQSLQASRAEPLPPLDHLLAQTLRRWSWGGGRMKVAKSFQK